MLILSAKEEVDPIFERECYNTRQGRGKGANLQPNRSHNIEGYVGSLYSTSNFFLRRFSSPSRREALQAGVR
jgi:hypothetical protein